MIKWLPKAPDGWVYGRDHYGTWWVRKRSTRAVMLHPVVIYRLLEATA